MAGLKYWVWLNECRGLTNRSRALLLDHFGSPRMSTTPTRRSMRWLRAYPKSSSSYSPTNRRTVRTKSSATASGSACVS